MATRQTYHSGPNLTTEQVATTLYQAGFRGDSLWQMTAIVMRESKFSDGLASSGAHGTNSSPSAMTGDLGLAQLNWDTFGKVLIGAGIIKSASDLFDPLTNAKAAKWVYDQYGLKPWSNSGGGYAAGGNPLSGTNQAAAQAAVQSAAAKGFVGGDHQMSNTGTISSGPVTLPSDARLVRNEGGLFAMFKLANGVWMYYGVGANVNTAGRGVTTLTNQEFLRAFGTAVNGGNAEELRNISSSYGSYANFWDSIVTQVLGKSNPAVQDAGVLRVIASFAARPDMSEAELQNRLHDTDYWRARTEGELQWNSLSPAERTSRSADTAARMQQAYFQFVGRQVGATDPAIKGSLEAVASGKMTMSQWTEQVLKPKALTGAESPWSRQVRGEKEEQRQRGVDVENTVASIRQKLNQWGLKWSEASLANWGRAIVEKTKSDDDLLMTIQAQATHQYGKFKTDPNVDTATAAAPWIETYSRVMENTGTVFTPEVAQALQKGEAVWDFEKRLKGSPKWRDTRNGREELTTLAQELGSLTGYA